MLSVFGYELGTVFQGLTAAGVISLLAGALTVWIKGIPERLRARTSHETFVAQQTLADYKAWRDEVHNLRNELTVHMEISRKAEKASHSCKLENETLSELVLLFIFEEERRNPGSPLAKRARKELDRRRAKSMLDAEGKSPTLQAAEGAEQDAKQALRSTQETVAEIKADGKP